MASVGHVLVGLAIARAHDVSVTSLGVPRPLRLRIVAAVAFAQLALLPDLDVLGFRFGVSYGDAFGHRGASHSLLVAVAFGLIISIPFARALRAPIATTAFAAVAALASHGLLDMLTDGGLGIGVFWPVSETRHFLPVQPLPVAPLGLGFLSMRGLHCTIVELTILSPFALFALLGGRLAAGQGGLRRP
jgi:inner membrane protein